MEFRDLRGIDLDSVEPTHVITARMAGPENVSIVCGTLNSDS